MIEIPKNKRYALGWYHEGITHLHIHEYGEALEFFEKALSVVPDHPDFLVGLGDVYFAQGNFLDAYRQYIQALYSEPDNYKAWLKAGVALLRLEKYREALDIFDNLLPLMNYDGELWYAHGLALLGLGEKDRARESLVNARRYKPNQPALWYTLAGIEEDPKEAIHLLQRGHHMDPDNLDILLELVKRLLVMGRKEEALQFCRKAGEVSSDHPQVHELMNACLRTVS